MELILSIGYDWMLSPTWTWMESDDPPRNVPVIVSPDERLIVSYDPGEAGAGLGEVGGAGTTTYILATGSNR